MELATLLRKVKREFGDEYGIIITDNDIFDWANDAQLKILRDTTSADVTVIRSANTFPYSPNDKVIFKRVAVNNRALQFATLAELDLAEVATTTEGTPIYWYQTDSNTVGLWPTPKSTDTYDVVVTYAKTPSLLSLVAPYLKFQVAPSTTQYAQIPYDDDLDTIGLNFYIELTIDNVATDFVTAQRAIAQNSTLAADISWRLHYRGLSQGNGRFVLEYGNGTTLRTTAALNYDPANPLINGQKIKIRVNYVPSTGIVTMYRVSSTGVETLFGTDDQADSFNLIGGANRSHFFGSSVGNGNWKLHHFKFTHDVNTVDVRYEFNGDPDLTQLPVIPASPFLITTGQTLTVVGGIQKYSEDNVFTVPEVWHEDIVRFCIARAHQKNRNTRAYETSMEEFQQGTSQRRYEAQSADGPTYRGVDPFDYGLDWVD